MCGIHNCLDGVEICIAHIGSVQPSTIPLERPGTICRNLGMSVPMLLPKSVAWNTLTLRSCCTLPTTSTALLSWRCASYATCQPPSPLCIYPLAPRPFHSPSPFPSLLFLYAPLLPAFPPRPTGLGRLTLFRCTFMLPLASIVAVSPRNDTTLPRMRTV